MNDEKLKRQRRFMLVLPLLTLPFVTLAFWALGGGNPGRPVEKNSSPGLNMTLPEAELSEDTALGDKMSMYQKADKKAALRKEQMRLDPFAEEIEPREKQQENLPKEEAAPQSHPSLEAMEAEVQQKLTSLQKAVDHPAPPVQRASAVPISRPERPSLDADLDRLEQMMQSMSAPAAQDPELQQIDGMLEKILDVQHPERVRQKLEAYRDQRQGKTFAVSRTKNTASENEIPLSERKRVSSETNRFYGLEESPSNAVGTVKSAIPAIVHEDQELVSGASLKMELTEKVFIGGITIPEGTLVFGTCKVNGERLNVEVEAIRNGHTILPVKLKVYDMDALPGIRVPGAITRKSAKEGAGDALQGMQTMSYDPSWQAQAASAGMETVKGLFSKKAKLVKVKVKAGHPLLLVDQNTSQP
ncbi:conjugative transposon protein TraM [Echinicola vietnamensis]|uniref:Conjugative transposon TraM protein n=1 Tax=Echinicola vietnamensis (strain DSM 17526 / LMG 23754 / KMM 6221) TaxID=926556 RepID=L0FUQ5_ECHVK|nr:conjugative transposon protein TraM [Echinicola vietnamensis]AGA77624.1 conjugative transposon TraM protein [Echinicola vietnamensis DSM 17526]